VDRETGGGGGEVSVGRGRQSTVGRDRHRRVGWGLWRSGRHYRLRLHSATPPAAFGDLWRRSALGGAFS
jgi:hypothetical protein